MPSVLALSDSVDELLWSQGSARELIRVPSAACRVSPRGMGVSGLFLLFHLSSASLRILHRLNYDSFTISLIT